MTRIHRQTIMVAICFLLLLLSRFSEGVVGQPSSTTQWLVYQELSDNRTDIEIYRVDIGTGETQNLTQNPTRDVFQAWSPDKEWIIFNTYRDGNDEIYRMRPDGTEVQNLTQNRGDDGFVTWAPDGEWMIFGSNRSSHSGHDIFRMRPDGTDVQNLTNSPSVDIFEAWSLDGEWIIFGSNRDFDNSRNIHYLALDLYRMHPDGSDVQELAMSSGDDHFLTWTPDEEWIIFLSDRNNNNDLLRMRSDGSKQENLTRTPTDDYLPEDPFLGDYMYFESRFSDWSTWTRDSDILRMNLTTREIENLTLGDSYDSDMVWSPDREWIVFRSDRDGSEDLFRMRPDGSEVENLTNNPNYDFFQSWSPDGEWLIFRSGGNLYRMHLDGTDISPITENNQSAWFQAWSPDGEWLVFRENESKLFMTRLDGSETRLLARSDGEIRFVSWYVDSNTLD